jgi:hypothetical protein
MPSRGGDSRAIEAFFGSDFIESGTAAIDAFTSIWDSALTQDFLYLPVFTEGAVDDVKSQFGAFREMEFRAGDIDFVNFCPADVESFCDSRRRSQRHVAFFPRSPLEKGNLLAFQNSGIHFHKSTPTI